MEVRPTFEREQKRSAARVQNVDHCLASENISLSQFVARQRFGWTGRERGCAASAACPVGLTSIFQRAAKVAELMEEKK